MKPFAYLLIITAIIMGYHLFIPLPDFMALPPFKYLWRWYHPWLEFKLFILIQVVGQLVIGYYILKDGRKAK